MQLQFFASKKEARVPCKHFGEESICSIMFFFSNQSSFVPFSTIQLCSPALCPSLTKAWIVFRAKFCTPASFGGNESPVRRTCRFEPEDITQHVTRCIYLSTYFSDVEIKFLVCTCHVRLICLFIYVYPKFFCWGFSPPTWPKKHDISSILSGISQYQKHTISLSQGNLKKNVSSGNQTWHGTPHLQWDNLLIDKL